MGFNTNLIRTALGKEPADLIIRGGKLVNVHSGQIYETDIAVRDGRIASIGPLPEGTAGPDTHIIEGTGFYVAPGFIDAHIHIESSMLTYTEFSKAVVCRGTTAVASDLMEVTIVSGIPGLKELLKEAQNTAVRLYYPVPSFMGEDESAFHTTGSTLMPEMIEELMNLPEATGLAEVLCPPILAESEASRKVLSIAEARGKTAEGHAPALMGAELNAYASCGIRSDHESTHKDEALAKLRAGLRVYIREGSASSDLREALRAVTEDGADTRYISLISDDIDALHIKDFGHQDNKVRLAIQAGVNPIDAIRMVTINPAESLKIDHECGSLVPGKLADIVMLTSLEDCRVSKVFSSGILIAEEQNGSPVLIREIPTPSYDSRLLDTVKLMKPVYASDLLLTAPGAKSAKVHVIGASGRSLLTESLNADLSISDTVIGADPHRDILHIACVERYGKHGCVGKSFIKGIGLKAGAIAISVGHDHHNITVVGTNGEDMAIAVNHVSELHGGIVYCKEGAILSEIPLPVCGLLSLESADSVAESLRGLIRILAKNGCLLPSPNVTLSFISLIFIPDLAITDLGLFDVKKFAIIDPVISLS
ncbi:adenine deaminase [Clostridia bacterium]|nr:adenine deaminase [Clostridia bacterium]